VTYTTLLKIKDIIMKLLFTLLSLLFLFNTGYCSYIPPSSNTTIVESNGTIDETSSTIISAVSSTFNDHTCTKDGSASGNSCKNWSTYDTYTDWSYDDSTATAISTIQSSSSPAATEGIHLGSMAGNNALDSYYSANFFINSTDTPILYFNASKDNGQTPDSRIMLYLYPTSSGTNIYYGTFPEGSTTFTYHTITSPITLLPHTLYSLLISIHKVTDNTSDIAVTLNNTQILSVKVNAYGNSDEFFSAGQSSYKSSSFTDISLSNYNITSTTIFNIKHGFTTEVSTIFSSEFTISNDNNFTTTFTKSGKQLMSFSDTGSILLGSTLPNGNNEYSLSLIGKTNFIGSLYLNGESFTPLSTTTRFSGDLFGTYSSLNIGTGVIGSNELSSTTVTPGDYTLASITVDSDGRITSASSASESDPVYTAWDKSSGISITESQVSDLKDYLTSIPYTTVSPGSYTLSSITVGLDGRLTSASSGSEIDPIFSNSEAFSFETGDKLKLDNIDNNANNYVLTVKDTLTNSFSGISTLEFNSSSGFEILNPSTGLARINMNSTFNPISVLGQSSLDATGEEELEIVAGSGISITTNTTSTPKKLTISSTSNALDYLVDNDTSLYVNNITDGDYGTLDLGYKTSNFQIKKSEYSTIIKPSIRLSPPNSSSLAGYNTSKEDYYWAYNPTVDTLNDWTSAEVLTIAFSFTGLENRVLFTSEFNPKTGFAVGLGSTIGFIIRRPYASIPAHYCFYSTEALPPPTSNGVYHAVIIWGGSGDLDTRKIFVNGVELSTAQIRPENAVRTSSTSYRPSIGNNGGISVTEGLSWYKGPIHGIDELAIYYDDKSSSINTFYNNGDGYYHTNSDPTLKLSMHFDEATGTTVTDNISSGVYTLEGSFFVWDNSLIGPFTNEPIDLISINSKTPTNPAPYIAINTTAADSTLLPLTINAETISLSIDNTDYITLDASDITLLKPININNAYTLPSTDGNPGQVLTTNGSGVLSWQDAFTVDGDFGDQISFNISSNAPISTGVKPRKRRMGKSGNILGFYLDAHISSSMVVGINKNGSEVGEITLTADTEINSEDLSGWSDVTFSKYDYYTINVKSNDNALDLDLMLFTS
jgi:hypothetical protein